MTTPIDPIAVAKAALEAAKMTCRIRILKHTPPDDQDQLVAIEEAEVIESMIARIDPAAIVAQVQKVIK
jgi:hypothetical protein